MTDIGKTTETPRSTYLNMSAIRRIGMALICLLSIEFWAVFYTSNHKCNSFRVVVPNDGKEQQQEGRSLTLNTSWAHHESYGILNDISDLSWKVMREQARNFHQYYPDELGGPNKFLDSPGEWYIHNLQPVLNCPYAIRVGGHGDGPKWICNPRRLSESKDCLIYSIGSAGIYTWEDALVDMLSKHCEIHVFDTSETYARPNDPVQRNIHYHNWGLKSSYADGNSVFYNPEEVHVLKTFPEILKELGHESRHIDILKIDCEGCEWYTYKDWIGHDVGQISIEIHGVPHITSDWYQDETMKPTELFDAFTKHGFAMYSKEVNSYGCGKAVEFSYLKMHPEFWYNAPAVP